MHLENKVKMSRTKSTVWDDDTQRMSPTLQTAEQAVRWTGETSETLSRFTHQHTVVISIRPSDRLWLYSLRFVFFTWWKKIYLFSFFFSRGAQYSSVLTCWQRFQQGNKKAGSEDTLDPPSKVNVWSTLCLHVNSSCDLSHDPPVSSVHWHPVTLSCVKSARAQNKCFIHENLFFKPTNSFV